MIKRFLVLSAFILVSTFKMFGNGHEIKFNIKNLNDSIVYLARYYGDNKYIKDTIPVDAKGKFVIKGDEALPCGIYLIVRQKQNNYLEFLVHDQTFSVISDTTDFINKTKFKDSESNEQLYEYFKFSGKIGRERRDLVTQLKAKEEANDDEDVAKIKEKISVLNQQMEDYITQYINENPSSPMSVVFKMQKDVEIPAELRADQSEEGKRKQYRYFLNHYWDNVDLQSECLLRTPLFHGKLQTYFDKVIPQHYDSVFKYVEPLVEKARGNDEIFRYIVNYVTFKWESGKNKRMCWDKVFYQMAKRYYLTGEADWVDATRMAKIESRVKDLQYSLCSEPAKNFKMKYYPEPGLYDTSGTLHDLYKLEADYVILWFWDSDCGHCKKQTPKLQEVYDKYKAEGKSIEVYAVNIEQESKGYKEYLKEHNYEWINVQDTGNLSGFRKYYDIYSTPVSYILDKERRIIGKRIEPTAIGTFLDELFKEEDPSIIIESQDN